MNIIDFTNGIGYNIIRFPDGEVHLQLNELDRREPVKVVIRICNAEDLFLFMQLSDILHRQDVVVEELHIPYLMSMRCDRVFSFERPFSLKIVSKVIRDMGARQVFLYEPHSSKSSTMTYASVKEITREYAFRYANTSTMCYPDKGAQVRYNLYRNDGELLCEKVRDVATGKLLSFKVTNPEEFNGEEITVHVKNTGRCRELLTAGAEVYLEESANPERKTKYDLVTVRKGDTLINMDSSAPNKIAEE